MLWRKWRSGVYLDLVNRYTVMTRISADRLAATWVPHDVTDLAGQVRNFRDHLALQVSLRQGARECLGGEVTPQRCVQRLPGIYSVVRKGSVHR